MTDPNSFSPERSKNIRRWQRNRDHTSGVDAVKDAGDIYLPRHSTMSPADYEHHKLATEYFPASARTLESHLGLVFRKPPVLIAPPSLASLSPVISSDAQSLEQLARWAFAEFNITNDGGILIDHPETPANMSLAKALQLDLRPFASRYSAESIREITYAVIGGRKRLVKVRLMDDDNTARHLELVDGVYRVTIWNRGDKGWGQSRRYSPTVNGQTFDRIPFTYLGNDDTEAVFDDLVNTNITHYLHASKLETAQHWLSRPKPWVAGIDAEVELDIGPASIWRFESSETKCGYLEFSGSGIGAMERQLDRLADRMAQLGSRMLAAEKAVAEAAETVARRQASENSILASNARHVSERLTEALRVMAAWMGEDASKVTYSLSTDFIPATIDASLLGQLIAMNQAGKLSDRQLFDNLQRGEIISEAVTYAQHQAELEATPLDPPLG